MMLDAVEEIYIYIIVIYALSFNVSSKLQRVPRFLCYYHLFRPRTLIGPFDDMNPFVRL